MSSTVDWSKAPEWAGAVISAKCCTQFWVEQYGKDGQRQRVDGKPDTRMATFPTGHGWTLVETRPTESPTWNGEGLPPVGTVCECQNDNFDWLQGTVVHVGVDRGSKLAIMQCKHEMLWGEVGEFRPIRTPEQVAAEEREKALDEMVTVWKRTMGRFASEERGLAEMLYDAGYRKVEQP